MTSVCKPLFKLPSTQLKKITDFYASLATGKQPIGAIFVAKKGPTTITAYRSGKVMFQGANAAQEAAHWQTPAQQNASRQANRQTGDNSWRQYPARICQLVRFRLR